MICYLVCQCCVVLYRCPARSSAFHWQHHFPCSSKDRIWGASSRCSVLQVVLWWSHTVLGIMHMQQLDSLLVLHATSFYAKAVRNWHISCMLHVVAVLMCCPQPGIWIRGLCPVAPLSPPGVAPLSPCWLPCFVIQQEHCAACPASCTPRRF